ncbi:MAG: DUF4258 domain-containing protein [Acidobacteria bacterium]|nr:DUF4258 domain-containing protein [Acidobacteriota bacterium]
MSKIDISELRKAVSENRYLIRLHAKSRMGERRVSDSDVKHVLASGDVIEQHLNARPYAKALFMAQVRGEPLYVSCAFDGTNAQIITVHWYDPNRWINPWTRKKG